MMPEASQGNETADGADFGLRNTFEPGSKAKGIDHHA